MTSKNTLIDASKRFQAKAEDDGAAKMNKIGAEAGLPGNTTAELARLFVHITATPERREELLREEEAARVRWMERTMKPGADGMLGVTLPNGKGLHGQAQAAIDLSCKLGERVRLTVPITVNGKPGADPFTCAVDSIHPAYTADNICAAYHDAEHNALLKYVDTLPGRRWMLEQGMTRQFVASTRPEPKGRLPKV